MTQDAAQGRRKGQTDLGMNLNLANAMLWIFDGIFDRDDLRRLVFDCVQGAIKRGAFAGAGRTGDQNDAVRTVNDLAKELIVVLGHADVGRLKTILPLSSKRMTMPSP